MESCTSRCIATKILVVGIVLILVRLYYPSWDIWVVIGALLIIKALVLYVMPACSCNTKPKKK